MLKDNRCELVKFPSLDTMTYPLVNTRVMEVKNSVMTVDGNFGQLDPTDLQALALSILQKADEVKNQIDALIKANTGESLGDRSVHN